MGVILLGGTEGMDAWMFCSELMSTLNKRRAENYENNFNNKSKILDKIFIVEKKSLSLFAVFSKSMGQNLIVDFYVKD